MNLKKMTALALALVMTLTLLGCGQVQDTTPDDASTDTDTVTVTDMAGREVTLPGEINSIATFGSIGVINAFVELMGYGDKIVNEMTASFTKSDKWAMQYEFAPPDKGRSRPAERRRRHPHGGCYRAEPRPLGVAPFPL